jgi:hypothetical protein
MSNLDFEQRVGEIMGEIGDDLEEYAWRIVEQQSEIEWLRELVESAYRDGWQDGSVRDPFGNVGSLDDWERSDTKAVLAEYKP